MNSGWPRPHRHIWRARTLESLLPSHQECRASAGFKSREGGVTELFKLQYHQNEPVKKDQSSYPGNVICNVYVWEQTVVQRPPHVEGAGPVMVTGGALKFRNRFAFTTHTQPHLTGLKRNQSFLEALILNSKSISFDVFLPCGYWLHQRKFPIILVKRAGAIKWILMGHMIKKCGNNLQIRRGGAHEGLPPVLAQPLSLAPPTQRIHVRVHLQ